MKPLLATICFLLAAVVPPPVLADGEFPQAAVPLHVGPGGRHLQDATGRPFLIHGDTAWSLMAELTREEAELYLSDRKKRGFNAIVVSLIEHRFASNAPANAYGERPFLEPGRFSRPNDRYFDHAEWVLRRAEELGLLVLLAPAYLGAGGGDEGWYGEMQTAGPREMEAYGLYLGRRFGAFDNILWLHGGDLYAPDKELVRAIVKGLAATEAGGLGTFHATPDTAPLDYWQDEPWLDLDTVYTYGDVYERVLERLRLGQDKPVLMLESVYEGERGANAQTVRAAAYGAILAGGAGHIFGNNPIWHFSGPGIHHSELTWQAALASPGAESMTHVRRLFESLPWWTLAPEPAGALLNTADKGGQVLVAVTPDRSLAVAYSAAAQTVTLDPGAMAGSQLDARWFDPASGTYHDSINVISAEGSIGLSPPSPLNADGHHDWLLILRAVG